MDFIKGCVIVGVIILVLLVTILVSLILSVGDLDGAPWLAWFFSSIIAGVLISEKLILTYLM